MLKYYNWIEPVYEKLEGVQVDEEEQREEEEYYREFPNAPKATWSCGGWVVKKDDEEPPAKKLKVSKAEALPKPSLGEINTNAASSAPGSPPERPLSKYELRRRPGPA